MFGGDRISVGKNKNLFRRTMVLVAQPLNVLNATELYPSEDKFVLYVICHFFFF